MSDNKQPVKSFCCEAPLSSNDIPDTKGSCPACGQKRSEHYYKCTECGQGCCAVSTDIERKFHKEWKDEQSKVKA